MAKRSSRNPTWSDVKPALANLDKQGLLALLGDLYRFSKENRAFFHARFGVGDDPLAPYKKTIDECMYPDVLKDKPIQIAKAKNAISSYAKAIGDPVGMIELMVYFVECGNSFTAEFGDIDEGFYSALNRMYRKAVKEVVGLPQEQQHGFQTRLKGIMEAGADTGWGYHDMLCDEYYRAFPEEG